MAGKWRGTGIPEAVMDSPGFKSLSPTYRAFYVDLRRQYNGYNNGQIVATEAFLRPLGWARSTIGEGVEQLIKHGLIERVRKGGIASMSKIVSLYAFTDMFAPANKAKGTPNVSASYAFKHYVPEPPKPRHTRRRPDKKSKGTNGKRPKKKTETLTASAKALTASATQH